MQPTTSPATTSAAWQSAASSPSPDEKKDEPTDDFAALFAASWLASTVPAIPAKLTEALPESPVATEAAPIASTQFSADSISPINGDEALFVLPDNVVANPFILSPEQPHRAVGDFIVAPPPQTFMPVEAGKEPRESSAEKFSGDALEIEEAQADDTSQSNLNKLLRAEAARRDSISVASALADTNRATRTPINASFLRPLFAESERLATESTTGGINHNMTATSTSNVTAEAASSNGIETISGGESASQIVNQSTDAIIALMDNLAHRGTRALRLRLHPEELGQIDIEIGRDAEGRLNARLTVEREAARHSLAGSIGQLREALVRAGLSVDRLDVSPGPGDFQTHTGDHGQNDQSHQPPLASTHTGALSTTERSSSNAARSGSANTDKQEDKIISLRV